MQLDRDGAQVFPAAFRPDQVAALAELLALPRGRPGARLAATAGLDARLAPAHEVAAAALGPGARAVAAKLFDKTPERNWSLGWHQDRTIALASRRSVAGFDQWTVKAGIAHCVPPFGILERSLTVRIHLDPAGEANAPLLIVPGSHRLGPIPEPAIPATVERLGAVACLADAGDVWACSTPILHASARVAAPGRRRVLQLLYSADALPGGLEWLGI